MNTVRVSSAAIDSLLARVDALLPRRHGLRVIPASEVTLKKLAMDKRATVGLTAEQVERAREIENASEPSAQHAEPVG
jgi:hypothetical protein